MMKRTAIIAVIILVLGMAFSTHVLAEEAAPAKTYSGDLWSRSTLTGD